MKAGAAAGLYWSEGSTEAAEEDEVVEEEEGAAGRYEGVGLDANDAAEEEACERFTRSDNATLGVLEYWVKSGMLMSASSGRRSARKPPSPAQHRTRTTTHRKERRTTQRQVLQVQ